MATKYVDFLNGNDANNGNSPDATTANTDKPWKTLTKALGAAGAAVGDTIILSPAAPFRELVTIAMTIATSEGQRVTIQGDPANASGFKNASGVLVPGGVVMVTPYTTDEKTAITTGNPWNFNGRDYLTFKNILFVGGNASFVGTDCLHLRFNDCAWLSSRPAVTLLNFTASFGVSLDMEFKDCRFMCGGTAVNVLCTTAASGTDFDVDVRLINCIAIGTLSGIAAVGTAASRGNGIKLQNCMAIGGYLLDANTANLSIPGTNGGVANLIYNSFFFGPGVSMRQAAGGVGGITENYNFLAAGATGSGAYLNVTPGANDKNDFTYCPLLHFGQERIFGMDLRDFLMPWNIRLGDGTVITSPLLGFGDDGTHTVTTDILHNSRPMGSRSASRAVGAYERNNTWVKETTTVRSGGLGLSATGAAIQSWDVAVDPALQSPEIYLAYDTNYGGGTKPTLTVSGGTECGVADASATFGSPGCDADPGNGSVFGKVTLGFTPARAGIVTLSIISAAAATGKAFADDKNW